MEELLTILADMKLRDWLDILLVALFFYGVFALLRETRSSLALKGFIAFMITLLPLYWLARLLEFKAMILIFQYLPVVVGLLFLIVFQNEIKKALTDVGNLRLFRPFFTKRRGMEITEILEAVELLADERIGALLAIERGNSLDAYTVTGTQLDAVITSELLRALFTKAAPTHDGAVVIQAKRLAAAGCILPVTDNPELSRELGTRHRAAIALSEETDAVVIVCSEETGIVSLVVEGHIERRLSIDELRARLVKLLVASPSAEAEEEEA